MSILVSCSLASSSCRSMSTISTELGGSRSISSSALTSGGSSSASTAFPALFSTSQSRHWWTSRLSPRRSCTAVYLGVRAKASSQQFRTCRNCKQSFDTSENNPTACRFHTAHFGGETKRKFESVHTGGTLDTVGGGEIIQYWHCCGSQDPFDAGCETAPHSTYDD